MERVYANLVKSGLVKEYEAIFTQYLKDGIIERIHPQQLSEHDQVYIPHRPVIKNENNVTTKIRVVLNCSLKVGKEYSINEAAFPGVDLLSSLFGLLLLIRSNYYLVVSDIRQAFLQIKLLSDYDKNKFTILWRDSGGQLIFYRYLTIVFGFVSSPFILNYVIKHHLKKRV